MKRECVKGEGVEEGVKGCKAAFSRKWFKVHWIRLVDIEE